MLICRAFPTPTSTTGKDQTTTLGASCPVLFHHNSECAGDGAYGLSSLSEKTTTYNLQMQLQRQYILLSYFKILSVGPVWGWYPRPPARQSGALLTEPTSRLNRSVPRKVRAFTEYRFSARRRDAFLNSLTITIKRTTTIAIAITITKR